MTVEMAANDIENGQCQQLSDKSMFENGVDLPSFGISKFINMGNGDDVQQILKRIRAGDKVLPPSLGGVSSVASRAPAMIPSTSQATIPSTRQAMIPSTSQATIPSTRQAMIPSTSQGSSTRQAMIPSTSQAGQCEVEELQCRGATADVEYRDVEEVTIYQEGDEFLSNYYPLPFTAGGTRPLLQTVDSSQIETVDSSQIEITSYTCFESVSDSALFGGGEVMMLEDTPKLLVSTTGYSRFRYQSERNTANKRPRQYEMDEDKRCLAEVEMQDYLGTAKVIAYCVNRHGILHPYNLFGTDCHNGVFVRRVEFNKRNHVTKLLKVSVTTPKAKEYQTSIEQQRKYLEDLSVITEQELPTKSTDNGDKQVVYLMVKVQLEDGKGTMLAMITKEIRNKKEGTEFRIRTVIPSTAPINGPCEGNPDKNKVCVIVTDNTAFPKDVCVVLKKRLDDGKEWLRVLKVPHIEVIRKSVVEFVPPPFREPTSTADVEVELTLRDLKTCQETAPAIFTYKGTDEYGLIGKGKKRKHVESLKQEYGGMIQEGFAQAERKTITAVRKRTGKEEYTSCSDVSVSETSPDNSVIYVQSQSAGTAATQPVPEQDPLEEREISIEGIRRSRAGGRQASPPSIVTTALGTAQIVHSSSYTTQPVYTQTSQSVMSQPGSANVNIQLPTPGFATRPVYGPGQQVAAVTAQPGTAQASSYSPEILQMLEPIRQTIAQNANKAPEEIPMEQVLEVVKKAYTKQVSGTTTAVSSAPIMSVPAAPSLPAQPVIPPYLSSQLPKLKPNQMFAMINGQFVILNDDSNEIPVGDNTFVQDIAGQDVIVQKMPAQQPSSEGTANYNNQANIMPSQYQIVLPQTTQSFTLQQNQPPYGYQQSPAVNSLPAANQTLQMNNQNFNQQMSSSSAPGFAWHNFSTGLDDDDIEIDSGAPNETDDDKKNKRQKSGESDTSDKVMEVADSENDGGFQNLPKILGDVSDESEGDEVKKDQTVTADEEDTVTVFLVSSSEDDSEGMQS